MGSQVHRVLVHTIHLSLASADAAAAALHPPSTRRSKRSTNEAQMRSGAEQRLRAFKRSLRLLQQRL